MLISASASIGSSASAGPDAATSMRWVVDGDIARCSERPRSSINSSRSPVRRQSRTTKPGPVRVRAASSAAAAI